MNDSSGSQSPKPDAQEIRAKVETRASQALSPANFYTEQRWKELRFEAQMLELQLATEPLIKASVKKHPDDWSRIFRLIQARIEIQPQIPRLRARYGTRPELFRRQVAKLVRAHARSIKLPKSATPDNFHIPANVPLRAVSALDEVIPVMEAMLRGETVGAHPNQFVEFFKAFSAGKPGPTADSRTESIRGIWLAAPKDKKPTDGQIAQNESVFGEKYKRGNGDEKRAMREIVRDALRPVKKSQPKSLKVSTVA